MHDTNVGGFDQPRRNQLIPAEAWPAALHTQLAAIRPRLHGINAGWHRVPDYHDAHVNAEVAAIVATLDGIERLADDALTRCSRLMGLHQEAANDAA